MAKCKDCGERWAQEMGMCRRCQAKRIGFAPLRGRRPANGARKSQRRTLAQAKAAVQHKHCKQCGLGVDEYMACELPDCGPLE